MDASLTKAAKSAPLLKNKIINIAGNYWLHAQNILAHLVEVKLTMSGKQWTQ